MLNGTYVQTRRLTFQLAHKSSNAAGNKPLAEVNGSPMEYTARDKAVTPVHDEHGAGDANYQMPQRQQQQQIASVPRTNYTPHATKSATDDIANLDSMYLDDPAVVSSTPHCYPLFKQNEIVARHDNITGSHRLRSENDGVAQDRWRPSVYGKMDNIPQRAGMHHSCLYC